MKRILLSTLFIGAYLIGFAQLSPAITSWLQNTSETGTYYVEGNSTLLDNNILYNCQQVSYSDDFVYVYSKGIPAYPTGPFPDGNPSQASDQDVIFKFPLTPTPNTGDLDNTVGGRIGVFINGVSLFDFRDGVAWDATTNAPCGGPANDPCSGGMNAQSDWNRDAIPAERDGFDCSKGHPANGNYHHHQNPSAFNLDIEVVSEVCNLYDADGLYAIDANAHSPLIGFAFDGYPIYGAYGYRNVDGSGGITRIKSSYSLRNITERTTHADGSSVSSGPDVDAEYFLGYYREDYGYNASTNEDRLDEHNGRFCVTPEYPEGTYAYFATVDQNWNSSYPYVVGPFFYGNYERRNVNAVNETTTDYNDLNALTEVEFNNLDISIFPNPASDLIAVQIGGMVGEDFQINLINVSGQLVESKKIVAGSTIAYFDTQTLYEGVYLIEIINDTLKRTQKIMVQR